MIHPLALDEARPVVRRQLADRYLGVRQASEALCEPLSAEDCVIQSMPDASPVRWHLAHTTWFFETFVLRRTSDYHPVNPAFEFLFNSYYNSVGEQFPRPHRGLLSRPTMAEVLQYRREVDRRMVQLLRTRAALPRPLPGVIELGLHHEQQHQELMHTDVKHLFSCNPLYPAYREGDLPRESAPPLRWIAFEEGLHEIGHEGDGFAFDNERPRHRRFVDAFQLASRPATNGEYLEFVEDDGYRRPELWLSLGWQTVQGEGWQAPVYWRRSEGAWSEFTLSGLQPLDLDSPVCHLSYFEADAFARWSGGRLPTEAEWEIAAQDVLAQEGTIDGNFAESGRLHPAATAPVREVDRPAQMFGDVWEWTGSAYEPYPGYRPPRGALGEYNGKFMCNQYVLRGGSCVTPQSHLRITYRNFFPPEARWQFTGVRLARDA